MKFSVVLLCLLAGLGACSAKDSPPDPYATVSMFCSEWGKAACGPSTVSACAGTETATDALTQACVTSQQAYCDKLMSTTTGYNSRNASQCLGAVQRAYSDSKLTAAEIAIVRHRGDPCNHLLKGPAGQGDTCGSDDDCNTLDNYLCIMKSGAGTCQIPKVVPNGDPCDAPEASCNAGYYCDGNCVKSKAVGGKCAANFECASGLACDPTALKCAAPVSQTECTADEDCAPTSAAVANVCDIPAGLPSGKCVSLIILGSSEGLCEDLR